ncbi:galactokinase [uncultured Rikenella sp.]|uniref:galactokinase n=1 Tax=uncultured Rikenella sp. TaxID=368003 RepID=UPI0025E83B5A|nr:galactokinase [uncultured Rikenella sp.]
MDITKVREKFKELYGTSGAVYTSPGRVNLIGEHTDYNGGFVLPGAVDKGMVAEIIFNGTDKVRAYALDLGESSEFGLSEADAPKEQWAKYIFGVCRELTKRGGTIKGFDTVFSGDVPLGAGMSSSAALESTYAFALNDMLNLGFPPMELAKVGQATEHNYVGVKCGIMDQFASIHGKAGHLMRLDCKTGEFQYVPFDPEAHGYKVVLIDSCVKHELVGSPYNKRRESCERAVQAIQQRHPEVEFLRDAQPEWLDEVIGIISQEDYIRAKYAIDEVKRLLDACAALEAGDYETVGRKMYGTHIGMSVLYEVSCEELDFLNEVAKECGVTGSRIMGGGFGGCTINVVPAPKYDAFIDTVRTKYKTKYGIDCKVYPVVISDGARRISE